jgi:hypothetical protein
MADEIVKANNTRLVGRPCKYASHVKPYLDDIYDWISQGMTEQSIYGKLNISHQAWIEYKDKYTELAETITRARQAAGQLLLNKQFAAGCGQKVTVRKQKALKDGSIVEVEEEEYIPPNVQAAEFWARHLMPDYVPPKQADTTKNINVNFQLEDWEQKRKQILDEIKRLELSRAVEVEAVPVDDDSTK